MANDKLTPSYWNERYEQQHTPWDIGHVSPPIKRYLDDLNAPSTRILIPGAGSAYEAIYAYRQGFEQVLVCDWAPLAFRYLRQAAPDFPEDHLLITDFFKLDIEVDLIIEQTFFSAIAPSQRPAYVRQAANLLAPKGRVAGLLFAHPFEHEGPPFGGTKAEYEQLFSAHFDILRMDISAHSITPRLGRELFFELQRR